MSEDDQIGELMAAFMAAISEHTSPGTNYSKPIKQRATVLRALIGTVAFCIESDPVTSDGSINAIDDAFGQSLSQHIKATRKHYRQTGERLFPNIGESIH